MVYTIIRTWTCVNLRFYAPPPLSIICHRSTSVLSRQIKSAIFSWKIIDNSPLIIDRKLANFWKINNETIALFQYRFVLFRTSLHVPEKKFLRNFYMFRHWQGSLFRSSRLSQKPLVLFLAGNVIKGVFLQK